MSTPISELKNELAAVEEKAAALAELQAAPGRIAKLRTEVAAAAKQDATQKSAALKLEDAALEDLHAAGAAAQRAITELVLARDRLLAANAVFYSRSVRRDIPGSGSAALAFRHVLERNIAPGSSPTPKLLDHLPQPRQPPDVE